MDFILIYSLDQSIGTFHHAIIIAYHTADLIFTFFTGHWNKMITVH